MAPDATMDEVTVRLRVVGTTDPHDTDEFELRHGLYVPAHVKLHDVPFGFQVNPWTPGRSAVR